MHKFRGKVILLVQVSYNNHSLSQMIGHLTLVYTVTNGAATHCKLGMILIKLKLEVLAGGNNILELKVIKNHNLWTIRFPQLKAFSIEKDKKFDMLVNSEEFVFCGVNRKEEFLVLEERVYWRIQLCIQADCTQENMKIYAQALAGNREGSLMFRDAYKVSCDANCKLIFMAMRGIFTSIYQIVGYEVTRSVFFGDMPSGYVSALAIFKGGVSTIVKGDLHRSSVPTVQMKGFSFAGTWVLKIASSHFVLYSRWGYSLQQLCSSLVKFISYP